MSIGRQEGNTRAQVGPRSLTTAVPNPALCAWAPLEIALISRLAPNYTQAMRLEGTCAGWRLTAAIASVGTKPATFRRPCGQCKAAGRCMPARPITGRLASGGARMALQIDEIAAERFAAFQTTSHDRRAALPFGGQSLDRHHLCKHVFVGEPTEHKSVETLDGPGRTRSVEQGYSLSYSYAPRFNAARIKSTKLKLM